MSKSTPFSIKRDLKGNPQLAGYDGLTVMAYFHPAGFPSDEAMEKTAAELVIAGNCHEALVAWLKRVQDLGRKYHGEDPGTAHIDNIRLADAVRAELAGISEALKLAGAA